MSIKVPIVVEYFGSKGIKRAIKEFNSLKSNGQKAAFAIKTAFKGVAFAAAGLATAIAGAAMAGWNFAKAAAEDQTSASLLAKQLRTTTKATDEQIESVEDWISKLQLANGIADSELRPNLAKLVRATGKVSKAQELLTLALDVSAGSGRDLDSVVTSLVRAYGGNLGGLTRLGISLDKTTIKNKDFTQAQKELAAQFGGAAATKAATFQGTMDRLNQVFGELKEAAGYALLEPLTKLADAGVAIFTAFGEKGVNGALEKTKELMATLFYDEFGQLNAAGQQLNQLLGMLEKLAKAGIIATAVATGAGIAGLPGALVLGAGATGFVAGGGANVPELPQFNRTRQIQGIRERRMMPDFTGAGPAGMAGVTVHVYNGDPNEVVRSIQKYQRRNGQVVGRLADLGS